MSTALLLWLLVVPQAQPQPDTAVVCPAVFRQSLSPWLEHRRQQGHHCVLLSNVGTAEEIRQRIRAVARAGGLRFVVLVGDAEPGASKDPLLRARCVPVHYAKAEVNVLWGSTPHIATDNWYADLDDDQVPDLAIGRLTADTPDGLRQIVAKILAYERSTDFGPWRRQLNFVAGVGGFGVLADTVLESATKYFLTQGIPAGYCTSMTYGSWYSPYCPDPRLFHAATLKRLNEGSWFWVYIGHGYPLGLDEVKVPGGSYHILANGDVGKLKSEHPGPIALFLACYTGAIDSQPDCLAEQMLRQPGGPIAVIAGSRVTMPYAMAVMATELMDACFQQRSPTVGEALLAAKRNMIKEPGEGNRRRLVLDTIAKAISPSGKLSAERTEHLLLFNLIGDPLLRLRHPKPLRLEAPAAALAGKPLEVAGTCPIDGRGTLEMVVERGRLSFQAPSRREYPQSSEALAEFQEVYERANDGRLAVTQVIVAGGRFAGELDVPAAASGQCHVRMFVAGRGDFALGAANIRIEQPSSEVAPATIDVPVRPSNP